MAILQPYSQLALVDGRSDFATLSEAAMKTPAIDSLDSADDAPREHAPTLTVCTSNDGMVLPRGSPLPLKYWCYPGSWNSSFAAYISTVTATLSWPLSFLRAYRKSTVCKELFIMDTGATIHATGNRKLISKLTNYKAGTRIQTAHENSTLVSHGCGHVISKGITLSEVHYVPGLRWNIVSASQLNDLDYLLMFTPTDGCHIVDTRNKELVGLGSRVSGMFVLDYLTVPLDREQRCPEMEKRLDRAQVSRETPN